MTPKEYKALAEKKRSKYKNIKCEFQGLKFDSLLELERYKFLLGEQNEDGISDLKLQVTFPLRTNGHKICDYRADFTYMRRSKDSYPDVYTVEDVKGRTTSNFLLKAKLFYAIYGYEIQIVDKDNITRLIPLPPVKKNRGRKPKVS